MKYENKNFNFTHQVIIDLNNCRAGDFILKNSEVSNISFSDESFSNDFA